MGNPQGPHQLACEYVGTQLAAWFGLPTFDYALMAVDATVDEIPLKDGSFAESGPAFVTRAAAGHPWGGSAEELDALVNPEAVTHLVVFDTWTLNCDRYPPDLTTARPQIRQCISGEGRRTGQKDVSAWRSTTDAVSAVAGTYRQTSQVSIR